MSESEPTIVVLQINDCKVVALEKTRDGYDTAVSLLNAGDLKYYELTDAGRRRLREFIHEYQMENFKA